jgi:vancomycin permeability regulator SanA
MVKADRVTSIARGIALFIAGFSLLNVLASLRHGGFDANSWWIDFRPLPGWVGQCAAALLGIFLAAWAIQTRMKPWRVITTLALLLGVVAVVALNCFTFYKLRARHEIVSSVPIPFSVLVLLALLLILRRATRRAATLHLPTAIITFLFCLIAFPLGQIAAFGLTDYRRPADAVLVLGARAYANGEPSEALEDRVLTAIGLYKEGLAPRLIFSGGPGDGQWSEPQVMRRFALARGVPDSAIILDEQGLTTDASIRNTAALLKDPAHRQILAVSHGWHLPRIKLRCQREGLIAYTVPADERGQMLKRTPFLVAREVAALWVYYLKGVVA